MNTKVRLLLVPVWLNNLISTTLIFMVIFMGVALFISIFNMDMLNTLNYSLMQFGFLTGLFNWNKSVHLEIQPNPSGGITVFNPSDKAMSIHSISNSAVYLLQDIDITGYVKIGRSANPYHRLRDFGVKLPFSTRLVHVIETGEERAMEAFLHERFTSKRIRGEWFALSQVDIDYIKSL